MVLFEQKYENLDSNRKKIYKDYYDSAFIISHLTELLINSFNNELENLQPVFLDFSYDKDLYKNSKILLANIRKQFFAFENKILINMDNTDSFSIDTQKILCISNQIKVYINNFINLLNKTDDMYLNNLVDYIFQDSVTISSYITYFTRQCRLDKRLFEYKDDSISKIIKKCWLFCDNTKTDYMFQYYDANTLSNSKLTELTDIERFPKSIKVEIKEFLMKIKKSQYGVIENKNILDKEYERIINLIKYFINQTKKIIIVRLMEIKENINQELLDYIFPNISFKNFNSAWTSLERKSDDIPNIDVNRDLKDIFDLLQNIEDDKLEQVIMWYKIIIYIAKRIYSMNNTVNYLQEIYNNYEKEFALDLKILEAYDNEDYERALMYEEQKSNGKRVSLNNCI